MVITRALPDGSLNVLGGSVFLGLLAPSLEPRERALGLCWNGGPGGPARQRSLARKGLQVHQRVGSHAASKGPWVRLHRLKGPEVERRVQEGRWAEEVACSQSQVCAQWEQAQGWRLRGAACP